MNGGDNGGSGEAEERQPRHHRASFSPLSLFKKKNSKKTAAMAPFKENPHRLAYALALLNAVTKA